MTDTTTTLRFGYDVPEGAKAAWGCRAIVKQHGYLDVPYDRSDAVGDDEHRLPLLDHLRTVAGEQPFDTARELLRMGRMKTREDEEFRLYEDEKVKVIGNTRGSGGYLYIVAFPKEGLA